MAEGVVSYELEESVAVVRIDVQYSRLVSMSLKLAKPTNGRPGTFGSQRTKLMPSEKISGKMPTPSMSAKDGATINHP